MILKDFKGFWGISGDLKEFLGILRVLMDLKGFWWILKDFKEFNLFEGI